MVQVSVEVISNWKKKEKKRRRSGRDGDNNEGGGGGGYRGVNGVVMVVVATSRIVWLFCAVAEPAVGWVGL